MSLTKLLAKLWWPRTVTATLGSIPHFSHCTGPSGTVQQQSSKLALPKKLMALFAMGMVGLPCWGASEKASGWELSIANGLILFKQEVKQSNSQIEPINETSNDTASDADQHNQQAHLQQDSASDEVTSSEPDYFMPAIESHLKADISGIVTRTTITQTFRNPYDEWLDGTYQFPLPEDAAVDGLVMRIGQREIVGEIKEKQVARALFNKAKANGQKASLVNQVKANMFTTALANIAPFEEIQIEIQLQQKARYKNGEFQLRFPTTYMPRFGESDQNLTDVREVSETQLENTQSGNFRFDIILDAGDALNYVASPHFEAQVEEIGHHRKHIRSNYPQAANRDLELLWQYSDGAPKLLHYREADTEGEYGLVMLLPGQTQNEADAVVYHDGIRDDVHEVREGQIQREVTLVIDTSSSMGGASIRQAKAALSLAVSSMAPWDKFNLLEFNSHAQALWSAPQQASADNISDAMNFLNRLEAQGGTNIYAALDLAISTQRESRDLQQIVFITDGAIGYEEQLLEELSARIGEARLFTVGIGSAPNSYFMVEAAKTGRGTFTHIASLEQVGTRMAHLLAQLAQPAITNLALDFGMAVEHYPNKLPDLYFDEPLVVTYKAPQAVQDIWAVGDIAGQPWQLHRQTDYLQDSNGISKLWANQKIRQLMTRRRLASSSAGTLQEGQKKRLRNDIVAVALKHGLVSKFTSLVAVERQISNPGLLAEKAQFGQLTPANRRALMQSMPQTATSANQSFFIALCCLLAFVWLAFKPQWHFVATLILAKVFGGKYVSK